MSDPNPQQQAVIDTLAGEITVCAGAGTGKTYTLTRRIVAAVRSLIEAGETYPLPINRIMAITFTRAAAAELRSRIRSALSEEAAQAQGETAVILEACALATDDAWISTIHAMAGRILRENALAFGLDPTFTTLTSQEGEALARQAMEHAVTQATLDDDVRVHDLMCRYPAIAAMPTTQGVLDFVTQLRGRTRVIKDGLDGVVTDDVCSPDVAALQRLCDVARAVVVAADEEGWSPKDAKLLPDLVADIQKALIAANAWLDAHPQSFGASSFAGSQDERDDFDAYVSALYAFPPTTNKFGHASQPHASLLQDYRDAYRHAAQEVRANISAVRLDAIQAIMHAADDELRRLKEAAGTAMDEDDLLARCNAYLADPAYADILNAYRKRFLFVMIDEFQDTDRLQMELISRLAAPPEMTDPLSGETGRCQGGLCTVGDVQQSIYRFRGADVDVSLTRTQRLTEGAGSVLSLTKNYRSHEVVLQVVEAIFGQSSVFGEAFLRLEAARSSTSCAYTPTDGLDARVAFLFLHAEKKSTRAGTEGVSADERRAHVAKSIAERFARLAQEGAAPSSMAILLGRMTHADVYADALRAVGLEGVISGGSVFAETPEAHLVDCALSYAVDPHDDTALLMLLTSPLFSISDDILLALTRPVENGHSHAVQLSVAFARRDTTCNDLSDTDRESLSTARCVLETFCDEARSDAVAALRHLFVRSGLLYRLEEEQGAESLASAGNLAKALRLVTQFQQQNSGISSIRASYQAHLAYEKEAPGTLSTSSSSFVQIMTVHASKGLEFDHVAVAELADGVSSRIKMIAENIGGRTYAALCLSAADLPSAQAYDRHRKVMSFSVCDEDPSYSVLSGTQTTEETRRVLTQAIEASSGSKRIELLETYLHVQELAEARRLLYVAMTRARESLLVVYDTSGKPSSSYKGIYQDIFTALDTLFGGLEDSESDFRRVADSVCVERKYLTRAALDEASADLGDDATIPSNDSVQVSSFAQPQYVRTLFTAPVSHQIASSLLSSYTSLSHDVAKESAALLPDDTLVSSDTASLLAAPADTDKAAEDATALGTAFHRIAEAAIASCSQLVPSERILQARAACVSLTDAQAKKCSLSTRQQERLSSALTCWFDSDVCQDFFAHLHIAAEVPFTVSVCLPPSACMSDKEDLTSFVLEGEIDGLATDGDGIAYLIDYKTGQTEASVRKTLYEHHRLQATCYAFALLKQGFTEVHCRFVRVEDMVSSSSGTQTPFVVEYSFRSGDIDALHEVIVSAWMYSVSQNQPESR